jgi:tetratricopeptide (TPR) repeat protein
MATRSGELAMRPLPAVLLDLHEELATGKLVLQRGRVSKSVDLVNGNPVSASSTPRDETLGHFLVGSGVITEEQHRTAVTRAAETGGKLGEALVALRVLTVEQLIDQLGKQARHKLVQALRWPQGAWRFEDGPAIEGMQLRMIEVVLSGLKETAVEDLDRLTRLEGLTFELSARGMQLRPEIKRVFGERALIVLANGAALADVERAFGGDRPQARIALDAMILCSAVDAKVAPVGLGTGPAARVATGALAIGRIGLGASRTAPSTLPGMVPPVPPIPAVPSPPSAKPTGTSPPVGPSLPRAPTRPAMAGSALFDILFEDLGDPDDGAAPLAVVDSEDSGVVSTADIEATKHDGDQVASVRQALAAEHQRIRGADHYAVLMVQRRATGAEIEAAATTRMNLADHSATVLGEPRDRVKLEELRRALITARATLLDERKRIAYDRELAGGELVQVPPAIDTELTFRTAEELIVRKQWAQAIGLIRSVITRSPTEADYHAALGWAEWKAGDESVAAADLARPHLNTALAINPDHAAAHDYLGRIDAHLEIDDAEALFHLERAVDLDPARADAVAAIEWMLTARGELRRYERILKRLLFRLRGRGTTAEAKAWSRLARLYLDHLDDPQAATAAASNARRIAPRDSDVLALVQRTENRALSLKATPDPRSEPLRAGWREALTDPASGAALVNSTAASGHADAAFLAASTMVGLGTADPQMSGVYEANRVRGSVLPIRPLGRDQWALLRHKEDGVELGGLIELVTPAIHALAPMTLADHGLDESQRIDDADLPVNFLRLRQRCANLLGVAQAAVYPLVDLGAQVHVLACDPPVLVAGDEALTAPERPELVFRIVRAMTFLWPGRAAGASRPGRVLRAVVMAVFREASGGAAGADDPLAELAAEAVAKLAAPARVQARAAALRLLSRGGGLNLSLWARSLTRTADRAGLLLCGDIPAAFLGAREVGDLDRDLVEFAYSAVHVQLRGQLGLA